MKVILQQDVRGQGKKGQLVEVSDGYARNVLLPRKLALAATPENMNQMKLQQKAQAEQLERERTQARELAASLQDVVVKIHAKAGTGGRLFGAVTSKEIAEALEQQHGIAIPKNKIVQEEPIKNFGSYTLKCKLGHETTGSLRVFVAEEDSSARA